MTLSSVSMVIPTYQRRDLVCEAVEALCALDYAGDFDLIVVVDGSTDGTAEALARLHTPFPLRIVVQPNGGLARARNAGAALAQGDILFFLDDDMLCLPDIVAEHVRSYAEGADAVVGEIPLEANSPKGFLTEGVAAWAEDAAREARARTDLTPFNIFGGQISVRRAVFEALGGFDTAYTSDGKYGKEDADFGARLLERFVVRHNPRAISLHRYVVSPREYLRRGFELGRADARFARRHLRFAADLFARNHLDRPYVRLVIRPLSRIPGLRHLLTLPTALAADAILRTPLRSSRGFLRLFHAVRQVGYWAGVDAGGGMPNRTSALVLCYHAIADHGDDPVLHPFSIPRERFEVHLASLRRRGFAFISASDLAACLTGEVMLPRRAVLLTFDDCYADLVDVAREILAPQEIPALAFAVTRMESHTNEWDQRIGAHRHALLTWDQLRQLPALGVEVGSHSRSHPHMPLLGDAALDDEARGSADDIAAQGLPRPRFFCFPFGERDARVCAAMDRAGYALAFGLADKPVDLRSPRFDLPRIEMRAGDGLLRFWLKTAFPKASTFLRWRKWRYRLQLELRALLRRSAP